MVTLGIALAQASFVLPRGLEEGDGDSWKGQAGRHHHRWSVPPVLCHGRASRLSQS
jgi:hypothetical protein